MRRLAEMRPVPASELSRAELLNIYGNAHFNKNHFDTAINAFTEAIDLCPDADVYLTNRATCYRKLKFAFLHFELDSKWSKVEEDCKIAIQLNNYSVKAHSMLGLALLERHDYAEGIKELEKAFDLSRGTNPLSSMIEEIWQDLAEAKYLEWEKAAKERLGKMDKLKEACEKALINYLQISETQDEGGSTEASHNHLLLMEELKGVFQKAADPDTPTEVPGYLCCMITLDILRDPVITPSGITYERAVLLTHLQTVGNFDPVTREPLFQYQLVSNVALRQAVQAYLKEHGWAYKMS